MQVQLDDGLPGRGLFRSRAEGVPIDNFKREGDPVVGAVHLVKCVAQGFPGLLAH